MRFNHIRLPHSEISGSKVVCTLPKLIAAYHVFHRLLAPRHPLYALNNLIPHSLEIGCRYKVDGFNTILSLFELEQSLLTVPTVNWFY
jgi:hypothetical protein